MTDQTPSLREIDAAIAEKVMGWRLEDIKDSIGLPFFVWDTGLSQDEWRPTTDIAQAFQVLEHLRAKGHSYFIRGFPSRCNVKINEHSQWIHEGDEQVQTMPEAICRAALAALAAKEETK